MRFLRRAKAAAPRSCTARRTSWAVASEDSGFPKVTRTGYGICRGNFQRKRPPAKLKIEPHTPSKFTDRKSTRLNSSHLGISYAVFCLKKKKNNQEHICCIIKS